MTIDLDFFEYLYMKAKLSFKECIVNPDNNYLNNEIDSHLDEIILLEDFISLKFVEYKLDKFVAEVKFLLTSKEGRLIGHYFYYEDEKSIPIDDKLIFD